MAQNITLLGASYSDVPGVALPKTGGGTATFYDPSGVTAVASDVALGKWFLTAAGVLTQGTSQGGGGSGLEYETGTYTPTTDVTRPTIEFATTHAKPPMFILFMVANTSEIATYSGAVFIYTDYYQLNEVGVWYSSSALRYGYAYWVCRTTGSNAGSGGGSAIQYPYTNAGNSSSAYARYFADESGFRPYIGSSNRYWRGGRSYTWIAVWK